jgi:hypothetical protein
METVNAVATAVYYILFALSTGALLYLMFWNPKDRQK